MQARNLICLTNICNLHSLWLAAGRALEQHFLARGGMSSSNWNWMSSMLPPGKKRDGNIPCPSLKGEQSITSLLQFPESGSWDKAERLTPHPPACWETPLKCELCATRLHFTVILCYTNHSGKGLESNFSELQVMPLIHKPKDYTFLCNDYFFLIICEQSAESAPEEADPSWSFRLLPGNGAWIAGVLCKRRTCAKHGQTPPPSLLEWWEIFSLFERINKSKPLVWVWGLSIEPLVVVSTSLSQNKIERFIGRNSSGLCSFRSHFCLSVICYIPHRKPSHLSWAPWNAKGTLMVSSMSNASIQTLKMTS